MALPPVLSSIISWLRAGYPDGVPEHDYLPLFALLGYHLSEDQVETVVSELEASHQLPGLNGSEDIQAAIKAVSNSPALESDVQRVQERLDAVGWSLQD